MTTEQVYTKVDSTNRPLSSSDTLGSTPDDVLIHHEEDESFFIDVGTTRSEAYILMSLDSKVTSNPLLGC